LEESERAQFLKDHGSVEIENAISFLHNMACDAETKELVLKNKGLTSVAAMIECKPNDKLVYTAGAKFMSLMLKA
jgi:hypothetical protein